jgi:hypothetical protein
VNLIFITLKAKFCHSIKNKKNLLTACRKIKLFKNKCSKKNTTVDNFLKYFEDQWVKINYNWFEGAYEGIPTHDNGLESTNRYIKDFHTFRQRLSLSQFLVCLFNLVKNWSILQKYFFKLKFTVIKN